MAEDKLNPPSACVILMVISEHGPYEEVDTTQSSILAHKHLTS